MSGMMHIKKSLFIVVRVMLRRYVCSGNSLDSSPNYTVHASKSKVRKSFEGLIRRLSGGRDSQVCTG